MSFNRVHLALLPILLLAGSADAQVAVIFVYQDHFEFNGRNFQTIDQLREAVRGINIAYSIRECGAEEKVRELGMLIREKGQIDVLIEGFPLSCE